MYKPQVIWVDGPTGSGKGHFIDNLSFIIENETELSITDLRAADYATAPIPQEDRKYTTYDTPATSVEKMYQGHLLLLEDISNILKDDIVHTDLVIVDRSFNSFLIHNLWQGDRSTYREEYLRTYRKAYEDTLRNYKSIYVQMTHSSNRLVEVANSIISRLKSRQDDKPIDPDWIYKLIVLYHTRGHLLEEVIPNTEYIESGNYYEFFKKYF